MDRRELFDQCPHRMVCTRCDFYIPKNSNRVQLLEAKTNLLRFLQEVPPTDEERAVADNGLTALDRLIATLSDKPTPSGQTPKQLSDREGRSAEAKKFYIPRNHLQPGVRAVDTVFEDSRLSAALIDRLVHLAHTLAFTEKATVCARRWPVQSRPNTCKYCLLLGS